MDRLGNIEAFVAAAELGSFTLAARRLGVSPSALSRRISQLEHEIGVRLLHRTTRTIRLSDEGRSYFERSRGALRELIEAHQQAARSRDKPVGLLKVEAPTSLGRSVVVPAISRFVRRYPEVDVELAMLDHVTDLFADGTDVAFRIGPQPDSALITRKLGTTWMRVYGQRAYLKRKGAPKSVEALSRYERIGFARGGRIMPWRLREDGVVHEVLPSRRISVNTGDALIDLAVAGIGLAWMCEFMLRPELVEVLGDTACEHAAIHAVSLPTRQMLPKVRLFVDAVAQELARAGVD